MDAGRIDVGAEAALAANAVAGRVDAEAAAVTPGVPAALAPGLFGAIAPAHGVNTSSMSAKRVMLGGHAAGVDEGNGEAVVAYVVGNADNEQTLSSVTEV